MILHTLKDKYKVKVEPFPEDVIRTLRTLTAQTLDEEAAKDATFKKIYQAYQAFSQGNSAWNDISEAAYARALKD